MTQNQLWQRPVQHAYSLYCLHFFISLPIQFTYASNSQDLFQKFDEPDNHFNFGEAPSSSSLCQSPSLEAQSRVSVFETKTRLWSHSLRLRRFILRWWLFNSVKFIKWYCDIVSDISFFGHEMPCASMYYNATLAQPWPKGVHTLRKHMRQVQQQESVLTWLSAFVQVVHVGSQ